MKKSMAILLSIVSILTSVAFGFYMKTQDIEFFNTIEMKSNGLPFPHPVSLCKRNLQPGDTRVY